MAMTLNVTGEAVVEENTEMAEPGIMITQGLQDFSEAFSQIHGYASVVVCVLGILTNLFNISVLTRRDMRSPTNLLLTWVAVSDVLTMLPYLPFVIHFYCPPLDPYQNPQAFSKPWMIYFLFVISVSLTTHTISSWLGVSLAVFRYAQLKSTSRGPLAKERRIRQVKLMMTVVFVLSTLVLIPNYLSNKLHLYFAGPNETLPFYYLKDSGLGTKEASPLYVVNVLTYALVGKIIPSMLMIVFSGSLVYHMHVRSRHKRARLSSTGSQASTPKSSTTSMLLVVIFLFVITELPQGVLILLSVWVPGFYRGVYMPLGDLMDFLALLNNAVNFGLYCIMSQQFRSRFTQIFLHHPRLFARTMDTTATTSERLCLAEPTTRTTIS